MNFKKPNQQSQSISLLTFLIVFYWVCIQMVGSSALNQNEPDGRQLDSFENDLKSLERRVHKEGTTKRRPDLHLNKILTALVMYDDDDDDLFGSQNIDQEEDMENSEDRIINRRGSSNPEVIRRLTEEEKKKIQEVFSNNLVNKLKQMFAISTRSRLVWAASAIF